MTAEESPGLRLVIALRNAAVMIAEECNAILAEQGPPEIVSATGIPRIDLAELDAAPWLTYKTKQPADPGTPAWIYNPAFFEKVELPQVIIELQKALNKSDTKSLQLGDMEYFFSGEGKFIGRRPAKKEKAT